MRSIILFLVLSYVYRYFIVDVFLSLLINDFLYSIYNESQFVRGWMVISNIALGVINFITAALFLALYYYYSTPRKQCDIPVDEYNEELGHDLLF